jgi:hypothetical protein
MVIRSAEWSRLEAPKLGIPLRYCNFLGSGVQIHHTLRRCPVHNSLGTRLERRTHTQAHDGSFCKGGINILLFFVVKSH